MNKEFNGFDDMVEALEENEDMVECKECFDLVPKVDCEKSDIGYICPVCKGLRTAPAQDRFIDPYDSYTQDFPEVTEYDPDSVVEYDKEPGLGDALSDLIRDEYEAIDGYEVADETIQHAAIDGDTKDEILDTLDHIKEEEEEHIDELKELCPECEPKCEENKEASEELTEDMKSKITKYLLTIPADKVQKISGVKCGSCDHELSAPDANGISKCPACSNRYVNKQLLCCKNCGGDVDENRDFKCANCGSTATGNKSYNQCKTCGGDLDSNGKCNYCSGSGLRDLDKKTADKKDINNATKEALVEAEEEPIENEEVSDLETAYEAALEVANEKGVGQVFGYASVDDEAFVAIEPFDVDDTEAVEDDLRAVYEDVKYAYVAYPEKELEEALYESTQLTEANIFTGEDKTLNSFFKNGYVVKVADTQISQKAKTYKEAEKLAIKASKAAGNRLTYLYGAAIDEVSEFGRTLFSADSDPTQEDQIVAIYKGGKPTSNDNAAALTKAIKNIAKYDKAVQHGSEAKEKAAIEKQAKKDAAELKKAQEEAEKAAEAAAELDAAKAAAGKKADASTETETAETETGSTETETDTNTNTDTKEVAQDDINVEETQETKAIKPETLEFLDKLFVKGYALSSNGEQPKPLKAGTTGAVAYEGIKKMSAKPQEEGKVLHLCANIITPEDLKDTAQNAKEVVNLLRNLVGKSEQKAIKKFSSSVVALASFKDGEPVELKGTKNLLSLIEVQKDAFEEYFNEESMFDETEPKAEEAESETTGKSETDTTSAESSKTPEDGETGSKLKAGAENVTAAFRNAFGSLSNKIGRNQANSQIIKAMQAAGIQKPTTKQVKAFRKALLGESLDIEEDFEDQDLQEDISADALETADALENAAKTIGRMTSGAKAVVGTMKENVSIKNMTSAMLESILNLSPADFAECTDSSRVELWGLEEAEDGVAEAVLIKSYDDI